MFRAACANLSTAFSRHWSAVKFMAGLDSIARALSGQNTPLPLLLRNFPTASFTPASSILACWYRITSIVRVRLSVSADRSA
jgi:hypothetical protein